ncbi:MAG: glycoside hydrolase family 38 C-terminal domain-containing protein [Clostridiales bacterium]|nr:glycoside hydrolase family 38 C-terminal domain-containing protein [Clostridiales bacterium]
MDNKIHLIGNAHLDPIWQWRWQEGCGEALMTFRSALDRLNEYPGFVFSCSSASYYRWVEEIDPEMFVEIRKRVQEGRWIPVNGWWVQPDCNIPSGESFARHALYSQLYYYEKFGRICRTGYNVDSFGHNQMLPQLLNLGGMNAYVFMRPGMHENSEIPESVFLWESPDGTVVPAYRIPRSYAIRGSDSLDRSVEELRNTASEKDHSVMLFYGVGNHGGGPTRGDIEHLRDLMSREFGKDLVFSDPDSFFADIRAQKPALPVWKNELQHHASGCYSVTSIVKALNRTAENALYSAEKWNTVSSLLKDDRKLTRELGEAWKDVLFNQFHDILDGCSIMEAYEDVRETDGHALTIARRAENNAHLRIISDIDTWVDGISEPVDGKDLPASFRNQSCPPGFERPIVVFNPHGFDAEIPVSTYHPSASVRDSEGNLLPFQNIRASSYTRHTNTDTYFVAKIPAMGYETFWLKPTWNNYADDGSGHVATELKCDGLKMENERISVEIDRLSGCILSIADKTDGVNILSGLGARPVVIDDIKNDTWAHNVFKFHDIKGYMQLQELRVVESGPVRGLIRAKYRWNDSYLTVNYSLTAGMPTLDVSCKVIWQEPHTLLKFSFPVAGEEEINTAEIPFGFIKRPCNGEEEPMQRWTDISFTLDGLRRGLALINDSKYSYDCCGKDLRLTALRSTIYADHCAVRLDDDFNFTDEGLQRFKFSVYPHFGEAENSDVVRLSALMNEPPVPVPCGYHRGSEPRKKSFLSIESENDNVALSSFKYSEDGSGALIVRAYETKGQKARAYVRIPCAKTEFWAEFTPQQTKTWRIEPDGRVYIVDFLEGIAK